LIWYMEFQVWAMKNGSRILKRRFGVHTSRVMLWRSSPKRPWVKWFKLEKWKRQKTTCSRTFYDFARHARIKWVYPLWIVQFWQTNYFSKNNSAYWLGKIHGYWTFARL
jgi:hypothetical protein